MGIDAWTTLFVVALVMSLLAFTRITAYLVLLGGLAILLTLRVISEQELLAGLANPGMALARSQGKGRRVRRLGRRRGRREDRT